MSALAGRKIVITRAAHQAGKLEKLLRERGAIPLLYPTIDIVPPEDTRALDEALRTASNGGFDWLVLTSANAVLMLAARRHPLGLDWPISPHLRVAAVGAATADAAYDILGLTTDTMPDEYDAEALVSAMQQVHGSRVFVPQSAIADDSVIRGLAVGGAQITAVVAYRTVVGSGGVDLVALLKAGDVDAITLTSGSSVANLIERLRIEGGDTALLDGLCIACIGSKTAAAAEKHGVTVSAVASEQTMESLIAAMEQFFVKLGARE
jgi:uroporphyrinogen-III synthase